MKRAMSTLLETVESWNANFEEWWNAKTALPKSTEDAHGAIHASWKEIKKEAQRGKWVCGERNESIL